ncbi:MAG: L,D-transpeptidase family protein [Candidatus Omnitrophota bacterium]|nr:L,D-transpeptidase family protein [Candidatus Omnitrophota bacterium]MDZ4242299.1 L,D-transpeptidase family protein [Candidatus Omnitrophota bacterium]
MDKKVAIISAVVVLLLLTVFLLSKGKATRVEAGGGQASSGAQLKELQSKASALKKDNEVVKAREVYQEIMTNYPEAENIDSVQKELETLNLDIIFSSVVVDGKTVMHEVVTGDTLAKIAKKYNTTVELVQRSNNLKSDVIRLGQKLRVWTGSFNVFVDKSQNILILKDGNDVVKVYQVSTGENNSTPVGKFKVTSKLVDPVWFHRGVVVPPESPANVLGSRWLGFDIPGYGIHGTVQPETIGQQVTAGCVRMRNQEVEELYSLIPMNTEVVVVD